ncbi:MAG: hypothetical protein JO197_22575 [Acidobacteria bacterium]|nr:hypothetical protein [Acidobacteriota bacterium]MBV9478007.1 hypothetical protein [Acidobacteriota bacterium]
MRASTHPFEDRITLVARESAKERREWNRDAYVRARMAFVDSIRMLKTAVDAAISGIALDVERLVIDRTGTGDDFLDLMSALPGEFTGDVLMIRDDGGGYLSATGRGGDRVLYALSARDTHFYLETHDLVQEHAAFARSA